MATQSRRPTSSGRAGRNDDLVPFALADGTVIAIQDTGPVDSRYVVVLVAGWTQDHTSWSDAGPRGSCTIDQLGDDVADLVTRYLPGRRVVPAGHSLGGPVVTKLRGPPRAKANLHRPDLIAGIIRQGS